MTCDVWSRLLALVVIVWAMLEVQGAQELNDRKVSILMKEEPENPKCFAKGRKDLTCFWEEDEERAGPVDQYTFTYSYQDKDSSRCPLTVVPRPGGKRLFVCHLNQTQMFVKMDIKVQREGNLIHNRSLHVEFVLLLDPPVNVTVTHTDQKDQLMVRWLPPTVKYMDDSMMYEVEAASAVTQTEVVHANSELVLRGLHPGTKYKIRVRVKMDGLSYDGFWSVWSEPVLMETLPADLDPIFVSLTVIILFVVVLLSLTALMFCHRYLKRQIWPMIPTPDSKFQDLFIVYGGDFQAWLGQTDGPLWLGPATEEHQSTLEVLSLCSPPLPPKTSRAPRDSVKEDEVLEDSAGMDSAETSGPHNHSLLDRLHVTQQPTVPWSHSSLLESQDTYITLSGDDNSENENLEVPLEVLLASRKMTQPESHSDLGSAQQSSGSGRLSSQSSFELACPSWTHKDPGYSYMAVADSGVSMDYSPMSRPDDKVVLYANDIPAHRKHFLSRQVQVENWRDI